RALNNRLAKYDMMDDKLRSNMTILFPEINNYSIGIQNQYVTQDSLAKYIAFIYSTTEALTEEQDNKLQQWMKSQFPQDSLEFIRKTSGEESPLIYWLDNRDSACGSRSWLRFSIKEKL